MTAWLLPVLLAAGCTVDADTASVAVAATAPETASEGPSLAYEDLLASVERTRADLGARYASAGDAERGELVSLARDTVEQVVVDELFPRWAGTTWAFYGTSTRPGEGDIACGYFVSTVLLHAGFRVERVVMAQQASEFIILSLVPRAEVRRFRDAPTADVIEAVQDGGDGLYLVGLDYHVGFLSSRGGAVSMCHSSYLGDGSVLCEDAASAAAMVSRYRVLGKLLGDDMMDAWLTGRALPTVLR